MKTEGKGLQHPILEDDPDDDSTESIDYEEEEEEFKNRGFPNENRGYARGVSFEELNDAGQVFQNNILEPASIKKAMVVVQKIQNTDLFYVMENAMDGSSRKIADLLNKNLPDGPKPDAPSNSDDFDIGDFL